jgi:hypothetical protein
MSRAAKPLPVEKKCIGPCGKTLPIGDFYRMTTYAGHQAGRVTASARCKACHIAQSLEARRRTRERLAGLEARQEGTRARVREHVPTATRVTARVPEAVVESVLRMRFVDVLIGDGVLSVRRNREALEREDAYRAEHGPTPELPPFNSTPLCPKGRHEFPIETLCRGYEALGCLDLGPHVHRKCPAHSVEVIERAPSHSLVPVYVRRRT